MNVVFFLNETSGVEVVSNWDDLRDTLVAETERDHQVLAVLHITGRR